VESDDAAVHRNRKRSGTMFTHFVPASPNREHFLLCLVAYSGRPIGAAVASVCRGAEAVQRFAILERGAPEVAIDNRKAPLTADDVRQQRTGEGFRRSRPIVGKQLLLWKAIARTRLQNARPQFVEELRSRQQAPGQPGLRRKVAVHNAQLARCFQVGRHLGARDFKLVVDGSHGQACHLCNFAPRVAVKKMQDEIAGAFGRFLSPDGVTADAPQIVLRLQRVG
jgi:hypothetical protein